MLELFGAGQGTASGETVTAESAMRVPAVLCAVRTIAETIASLPIHLYKRGPDGSRERDRDHPAAKVLGQPVPWQGSSYDLKLALVLDAIRHGQAFAIAARASGVARELHRISPTAMAVEHDDVTGEPTYILNPNGRGARRYGWRDVVHLVPLPADPRPVSLISLARESVGFAATLEKHGARLFANGGRPGGVLKAKGKLNADAVTRIRKAWLAVTGGDQSGSTAVLEEGIDWQALTLTSTDAQYLELCRFQVLQIARVFRVPPHMLSELERATHSNAESLGRQFVAYCIRPWTDLIESALTRVLLTPAERSTHFLEFSFDDLTRADTLARFDALQKAIGGPWLTPNEGRAVENRGPVEGGDELNQPQGVAGPAAGADEPAVEPPVADPKLRAVA